MTKRNIDLRDIALRYHIDLFRLTNKAIKIGLDIKDFSLSEDKLEGLVTIEDIPQNDKIAVNRFKHDDTKRRLDEINTEVSRYEKELKAESEKDEVREKLNLLYSERNSLSKQLVSYSQYNGFGESKWASQIS